MNLVAAQDDVVEKIYLVVAEALNKDVSQLDHAASRQSEEAWDSLGQLRIIAGLEEAFAIEFSDEQVMGLTSLPELRQAVLQLLVGQAGNP